MTEQKVYNGIKKGLRQIAPIIKGEMSLDEAHKKGILKPWKQTYAEIKEWQSKNEQ